MEWLKNLWNGFIAILMFLYLILVLTIGKVVGLKHLHNGYWSWLRTVIFRNGPIWVKICQWISNRPDICNPIISDQLSSLREHCPEHSWKTSANIFKEDTRQDILRFFTSIEKKPFASGSIGQVYRATLSQTVTNDKGVKEEQEIPVVVKIQHPDLDIKMKWFFVFVKWWNNIVTFLGLKKYVVPISVEDMEKHLLSQLDYKQEATNMKYAHKNFENNPHVVIPEVYYDSFRVLVTREESGVHYKEFKKKYPTKYRELSFVDNIIKMSIMQMTLINDMTHADLHDGNWSMRILDTDKEKPPNYQEGYPQVVIYDWGLVTSTGNKQMNRDFIHQLRIGDFNEILNLVEKYISIVGHWKIDKFKSFRDIALEKFKEEKSKKDQLRLKDKINIILTVIRTYNFTLKSSLVSLMTTILLLQEQMITKREVNHGDEESDYVSSVSIQLAFCRGLGLFREYANYLEEINKKIKLKGTDLFGEGSLYLKQYNIGCDDVSDVDSWDLDDESVSVSDQNDNENDQKPEQTDRDDSTNIDDTTDNHESMIQKDNDGTLVIDNSVYTQTLSGDMMEEIRQELLQHFPYQSQSTDNNTMEEN